MKNTTRKTVSQSRYPSKESRWAYGMQAIEPNNKAINEAFSGFHPQFVMKSQSEFISPEKFIYRRLQLGMDAKQCAAFLRISERTLSRWENGHLEIPFMAFELLRVLQDNLYSKVKHKAWDGWFISANGELVSPNFGRCAFTPERLQYVASQGTEAERLRTENKNLERKLLEAQAENTKLRQMFVDQGVVDELYTMKDRLTSLVKQLGTARILPLKKCEKSERMRKAA